MEINKKQHFFNFLIIFGLSAISSLNSLDTQATSSEKANFLPDPLLTLEKMNRSKVPVEKQIEEFKATLDWRADALEDDRTLFYMVDDIIDSQQLVDKLPNDIILQRRFKRYKANNARNIMRAFAIGGVLPDSLYPKFSKWAKENL
jgi:hypothetical protein